MAERDSPLVFPCAFPLKVVGERKDDFAQTILDLVAKHAPGCDPASIEMRVSSRGRYLSLTFVITATSQAQLDALYRELVAQPAVKFVL